MDIPELLRPLLERAPKIPDLFDRHERIAQRFALDLIDLGIPPAKAIERAEVRAVKLSAQQAQGAAGEDIFSGGEGQATSFTSGAIRDAAGDISQSFDRNRAEAAANPEDNAASAEMFEGDFTEGDRDVTGRAIGRFAQKIAEPLDKAQEERQRAKEKARVEKELKREEETEKLRRNPVDRAPVDRNREQLDKRLDGRDIFKVFEKPNDPKAKGVEGPFVTQKMIERIGAKTLRPILEGAVIFDRMTPLEKQKFNNRLVDLEARGVIGSQDNSVFRKIKAMATAVGQRATGSRRIIPKDQVERAKRNSEGMGPSSVLTGMATIPGGALAPLLGIASFITGLAAFRGKLMGEELKRRSKERKVKKKER